MAKYTAYDPETGEVRFTFNGTPKGAEANAPCVSGWFPAKEYTFVDGTPVKRPQTDVAADTLARRRADLERLIQGLLEESDWTQLPDVALSGAQKNAWQAYRKQLRDLPHRTADPDTIVIPEKPAA